MLNFDCYGNTNPSLSYLTELNNLIKTRNFHNTNSNHILGKNAKIKLDHSISHIKEIFSDYQYVEFVPGGGTVANERIFTAFLKLRAIPQEKDIIIISSIEHTSISKYMFELALNRGYTVIQLSVDKDCRIDIEEYEENIRKYNDRILFVSIMNVNNETGIKQPIKELVALSGTIPFFCDSSHSIDCINTIPIEFKPTIVTASLYKYGGGHVGLILSKIKLPERYYGTPDIISIVPSVSALNEYMVTRIENIKRLKIIKTYIIEKLEKILNDFDIKYILINNKYQEDDIIAFIIPEYKASYIQTELSNKNICIGSGSACNKSGGSHTLLSMGYNSTISECLIRISFDIEIKDSDIDTFCNEFYNVYKNIKLLNIQRNYNLYRNKIKTKITLPTIRKEEDNHYDIKLDTFLIEPSKLYVTYGELALKGNNKHIFVKKLLDNIKKQIRKHDLKFITRESRLELEKRDDKIKNFSEIINDLQIVPGISNIYPIFSYTKKYNSIEELLIFICSVYEYINIKKEYKTFCIRIKINEKKTFCNKDSKDLEYLIGKYIRDRYNITVNLKHPDILLNIAINNDTYNCYNEKYNGTGGLPIGTEGTIAIIIDKLNKVQSFDTIKNLSIRGANIYILLYNYDFNDSDIEYIKKISESIKFRKLEGNIIDILKTSEDIPNSIIYDHQFDIIHLANLTKQFGILINKIIYSQNVFNKKKLLQKILPLDEYDTYNTFYEIMNCIFDNIKPAIYNETNIGLSLLSGGIDSPVSSKICINEKLNLDYIHFSSNSLDKENIINTIKKISDKFILYFIDITELQKKIVSDFDENYRTMLYKVYMILISNKIAKERNYTYLVMGNSLGQVASQTPKNFELTMQISNIPILNPVFDMNKTDIIKLGREFGTYDMSICNGEDCCTMFLPKNPILAASKKYIDYVINKIGDYSILYNIEEIIV